MAAETGFLIDDVMYETPSLDTFTMDEAQVLYDYSGLTIEDFVEDEDGEDGDVERLRKLKNPGFMRALMHIAYQREHPKTNTSRVKALIGSANLIGALEHLVADEDDAVVPPALTTEPEPSSPSGSVVSNGTGGDDSKKSSDEPADPPPATTTTGSDTSSTSAQTSSVA